MTYNEYITAKQSLQRGHFDPSTMPIFYEYYRDLCIEPLVKSMDEFVVYFRRYLETPYMNPITQVPESTLQQLFQNMQKIFNHLDKRYTSWNR